jgi:hypothetical protein
VEDGIVWGVKGNAYSALNDAVMGDNADFLRRIFSQQLLHRSLYANARLVIGLSPTWCIR